MNLLIKLHESQTNRQFGGDTALPQKETFRVLKSNNDESPGALSRPLAGWIEFTGGTEKLS